MLDSLLQNAAKGTIPHAILLYGSKDDRDNYAIKIAKAILCLGQDKPCGVCDSCKKIALSAHPDFMVIEPDTKKSKYIRVDEIRDLIAEINIRPALSGGRVVYIPNAGAMNLQAQNALLKSLEEPPFGCVFILGVLKKDELISTINSRCTPVLAKGKSAAETEKELIDSGVKDEIAHVLSNMCLGTEMSAAELSKDKKKLDVREKAIMACRVLFRTGGFVEVSKTFKDNIDEAEYMIAVMETVFRDMLVYSCKREEIINIDQKQVVKNGSQYFKKGELLEILQIINALRQQLCYNVVRQLAIEAALLRIMEVKNR